MIHIRLHVAHHLLPCGAFGSLEPVRIAVGAGAVASGSMFFHIRARKCGHSLPFGCDVKCISQNLVVHYMGLIMLAPRQRRPYVQSARKRGKLFRKGWLLSLRLAVQPHSPLAF